MLYEVGDKVTVRNDLEEKKYGNSYDVVPKCSATEQMVAMAGKTVTISEIDETWQRYEIAEDEYHFCWVDDMFEKPNPIELKDVAKSLNSLL